MSISRFRSVAVAGLLLAVVSSCMAQETGKAGGTLAELAPQSPLGPAAEANLPGWSQAGCTEGVCADPLCVGLVGAPHWSLQFIAGCYPQAKLGTDGVPIAFGPDGKILPHHRIHFDLVPLALRLGWEPLSPMLDGTCLRGDAVVLFEWTADIVTRQFGNYVTGPSLLLRYQFLQEHRRFVPYCQVGAGIVFDDAYRDQVQRLIGGSTEFLLQAELGLHYCFRPCVSLDVEGGYQHISNANTYARNTGVNSLGGSIGFTYHFGKH